MKSAWVLTTLLLALAGAQTAHAQAAKPVPGCAGAQITDEQGDVSALAGPTATNLDIIGGFFLTDPKGTVTANMQIADMSLTPPPPATAVSWYTTWVVGNTTHYVSMEVDILGSQVFEFGTYGPSDTGGFAYTPAGETTGSVFEGPEGVISIVAPKAAKGSVGQKLTTPAAQSFQLVQNGLGGGVLLFGDETDAEAGVTYDVGACEMGGAPADGGAGTAPGAQQPDARPSEPAPKLPLTLATKSVKPKRGTLRIRAKAGEDLTSIRARLRKGKRALGSARVARIAKGATATLKFRARGVRRGSYVLEVTGRLPDGRLASVNFRLRVR